MTHRLLRVKLLYHHAHKMTLPQVARTTFKFKTLTQVVRTTTTLKLKILNPHPLWKILLQQKHVIVQREILKQKAALWVVSA